MVFYHRYLYLTALLAVVLLGCSSGISRQVRSQVTYFGPFADLQRHPDRFKEDMVILGGRIIANHTTDKGTELEVLQLELDGSDRPEDNSRSAGRFLVRTDQFLDPAIYARGLMITVAGRVQGGATGAIGQMTYSYPVIRPVEIKKWPPRPYGSRFHFGIGIGTTF